MHGLRGFTLIELLVSMAVLGLVLAMAVPTLSQSRRQTEVKSVQARLLNDLTRARTDAISRGNPVSLCASSDGSHCDGSWNGWLVFEGPVPNTTTAVVNPISQHSINAVAVTANRTQITFASWGVVDAALEATLCDGRGELSNARALQVSALGRARTSVDADNDSVHEAPSSGSALSCG